MSNKKAGWILACVLGAELILTACGSSTRSNPEQTLSATPTPTPTVVPGSGLKSTPTPPASRCEGLSGVFELQLLVGLAEAVGLEPFAIGDIPFSVISAEKPYIIEGSNTVSYDDVLAEQWGTYTVSFYMDVTLGGECSGEEGAELLMVDVTMSGDQMVVVESEGFQGEYPWSGTHENTLTFPLEEGATASGEGWQLVLHLNQ
jgi:hypothetical protein